MEALYSKLYDKYTRLKAKKEVSKEKLDRDQEVKFVNCVSAAEELIEYLRSENNKLRTEVSDLRSEVTSIRSSKDAQYDEYEKILMEENHKYKELSEEVWRLRNQEHYFSSKDDGVGDGQMINDGGSAVESAGFSNLTKRKRTRGCSHEMEVLAAPFDREQHDDDHSGSGKEKSKETIPNIGALNSAADQPKCCRRKVDSLAYTSSLASCLFQELVECLLSLKFSIVNGSEETFISAVHESSGYSFSLKWMNNSVGEEELMYNVSSLGTFERVAPEWMREVLLFSKSMCPVFFKRVSHIIKLYD